METYEDWYDKYCAWVSDNIFRAIVPDSDYLLWRKRRDRHGYHQEYQDHLQACYAETVILASEVIGEG